MEIIKKKNIIQLYFKNEIIEEYSFKLDIDFKKLIEFLLKDNLNTNFNLKNNLKDMNTEEENLVNLINSIIDDYNIKVDEYKIFINQD